MSRMDGGGVMDGWMDGWMSVFTVFFRKKAEGGGGGGLGESSREKL